MDLSTFRLDGKRYVNGGFARLAAVGINERRLINLFSIVFVLTVWELFAQYIGMRILLAPPSAIGASFMEMVRTGELQSAVIGSFQHATLGYLIAVSIAIPLGFLTGQAIIAKWAIDPYLDAVWAAPAIAYIPLIIIWFGLGFQARVVYVFIRVFYQVYSNTQEGVESFSKDYADTAKSFGASWAAFQRKVMLPASLPVVSSGLIIGAGRGVRAMIAAELFLAIVNLGAILVSAGAVVDTSKQLAVIGLLMVIGVTIMGIGSILEQKAMPWHFDSRSA